MDVDDYVLPEETEYCRTDTSIKMRTNEGDGTLVCTDSRLVFSQEQNLFEDQFDEKVIDIQTDSIEEIEYRPRNVQWLKILGAVALMMGAAALWFQVPEIQDLERDLRQIASVALAIGGIGVVVGAIFNIKPTLIVRTTTSSHEFRGGDLGGFPHAIRRG